MKKGSHKITLRRIFTAFEIFVMLFEISVTPFTHFASIRAMAMEEIASVNSSSAVEEQPSQEESTQASDESTINQEAAPQEGAGSSETAPPDEAAIGVAGDEAAQGSTAPASEGATSQDAAAGGTTAPEGQIGAATGGTTTPESQSGTAAGGTTTPEGQGSAASGGTTASEAPSSAATAGTTAKEPEDAAATGAATEASTSDAAASEGSSAPKSKEASATSASSGASGEEDAKAAASTSGSSGDGEEAAASASSSGDEEKEEIESIEGELYSEDGFKISFGKEADIPEGAELSVNEISPENYESYIESVYEAAGLVPESVAGLKVLDISIVKDDEEIYPQSEVYVELNADAVFGERALYSDDEVRVVHINGEDAEPIDCSVITSEEDDENDATTQRAEAVGFNTGSFSPFAIIQLVGGKSATVSGGGYEVTVNYDNTSGIPAGTEFVVDEVGDVSGYGEQAAALFDSEIYSLEAIRAFNIGFVDREGEDRYQPGKDISVSIRLTDNGIIEGAEPHLISYGGEPWVMDAGFEDQSVGFSTTNLTTFGIAQFAVKKTLTAGDGRTYLVTVNYDSVSGIPEGAVLSVSEITDGIDEYAKKSSNELDETPVEVVRAFDISLRNPETGEEYQPTKPISVSIDLFDEDLEDRSEDLDIVHIHGNNEEHTEVVDSEVNDGIVEFEAESFSVYVVVRKVIEETLTASDGREYLITVSYDSNTGIPENAQLAVSELTGVDFEDYKERTAQAMGVYAVNYAKVFDISIVGEDGTHYQPNKDVKVSIELMGEAQTEDELTVVHFGDEVEVLDAQQDGSHITFTTDSFSVYSLGSYHLRTYRFFTFNNATEMKYVEYNIFTDSGTTTFTQIIKDASESLVVPKLPSLEDSETTTFAGWYVATNVTTTDGTYYTAESIADDPFDFTNIPPVTENGTVYLFAKFADFGYVVFHDQYNGSTQTYPVAETRRAPKIGNPPTATIQISDVTVDYDDDSDNNSAPQMAFYGWSYTAIQTPGDHPEYKIDADNVTIAVDEDPVHLYPIFQSIYWLSFNSGPNGSGATYVPSKYYYRNDGPTSLRVPVRSGYKFAGWYADAIVGQNGEITNKGSGAIKVSDDDGTLINGATGTTASVSGGKLLLTASTELAADWDPTPVKYTIVVWRQKFTDAANLQDANKTYDYAESFAINSNTGASVSVAEVYKQLTNRTQYNNVHPTERINNDTDNPYYGFNYNGNKSDTGSVIVKGDGSTVLNVYYDRNVHTLTFRTGNNASSTVKTITALYGASIKDNFPIVGTNGTTYDGYEWQPQNSSYYTYNLATIETMPNVDVTFKANRRGSAKTIYYYVEIGDSSESLGTTRIFNGKLYTLYKTVNHNFNFLTYNEEYHPIDGYTRDYSNADPAFSESDNRASIGSGNKNYLYYDREEYEIEFYDSYTHEHAYVNGTFLNAITVKYKEAVKNFVPDDPTAIMKAGDGTIQTRSGYSFKGWYADEECTTPVFFDENDPVYQDYVANNKSCVLYDKMPSHNLKVYADWETLWYKIVIDPNYGWISDGTMPIRGKTWFWEEYYGDLVEEYTFVKRDYVESSTGTYYYHYDRRSDRWGEEWTSEEDQDSQRYAYYTQDLNQATELKTFKYAENAYRYAGWYEVTNPNTDNETEALYDFSSPITHDLYLRLHWKKIGTYYINYNATVSQGGVTLTGTLDSADSNETLFVVLDEDDYADNADVIVTRTAYAPDGYNFAGWKIRGDSSGTIYAPGQSFNLLAKYTATVGGKETIFLDAVYTRIGTAKIIYDANTGSITEEPDYGEPLDDNAPPASTSYDTAAGTATIKNLVNNSRINLSDGRGFEKGTGEEKATLVGWNTKIDGTGDHFDLNGDYYVDTEEPVTLYAEWKVNVYFHRNRVQSRWGSTSNWPSPTYTAVGDDVYYITTYINRTITVPADIPVNTYPADNLSFRYWGTDRYSDVAPPQYDFSTIVTDVTHLYAYWAGPIELKTHARDATDEVIADKDNEWLIPPKKIDVNTNDRISFTESIIAANYSVAPDGYRLVFTAAYNSTADIQNISEDDAISEVYYNVSESVLYVKYVNNSKPDAALAATDEIYFVYDKDPVSLDIKYKWMDIDRSLKNISVSGNPTSASLSTYSMKDNITGPKSYITAADAQDYTHYAYAVGASNATSDTQLTMITTASSSDGSRPNMLVRNTWRGYEYSTDGTNWVKCGYSGICLYVVYFKQLPTIVNLHEVTYGTTPDMNLEFKYTAVITTTTEVTTQTQSQSISLTWSGWPQWGNDWTNTGSPTVTSNSTSDTSTYMLNNGDSESITLFYTPAIIHEGEPSDPTYSNWNTQTRTRTVTTTTITQTVVITQNGYSKNNAYTNDGYVTDHDGTGTSHTSIYVYTYTTSATSEDQTVTYTNIHTPLEIEVHVAIVSGNNITLDDNHRKNTAVTDYTISLPIDRPVDAANTKTFLTEIAANTLFTGDITKYGFAGIICGTSGDNQGDVVTVTRTGINKITYGHINNTVYEPYFEENNTLKMGENKIYYLYYPLPKMVYVKEGAGGALTRIQGSTDGQTVISTLTYNGAAINLNGVPVEQEQLLSVSTGVFRITQNMGTGNFIMPPYLDDGTDKLYLQHSKIGVAGTANVNNTGNLARWINSKDGNNFSVLYLTVVDSQVKWSTDNNTWNSFGGAAPTVYAIYKEKGYELNIIKELVNDTDNAETKPFRITVESMSITASSYEVTGTGYNTVDAIPVNGSTPGKIELSMSQKSPNTSDITIIGLPKGDYTITENNSFGYTLTAKSGDAGGTLVDTNVTNNKKLDAITLNGDKKVVLTNTRKYVIVTVKKLVEDVTDTNRFGFTVTYKDNGTLLKSKTITKDAVTTITDGNGTVAFKLTHNTTQQIAVPVGADIEIAESSIETADAVPVVVPLTNYVVEFDAVNTTTPTVPYSRGITDIENKKYRIKDETTDDEDGVPDYNVTVTFTNNIAGLEIKFKKIDGAGDEFTNASATFTLFTNKACTNIYYLPDGITSITGNPDGNGIVTLSEKVPYGVYYMKETTVPSDYVNSNFVYEDEESFVPNVYVVLVGDDYIKPSDPKGTGLWLSGALLSDIRASDIADQTGKYKTAFGDDYQKYAIFLIDKDTNKAVACTDSFAGKDTAGPDIAGKGIMNVSKSKRKAILKKVNSNKEPLAGAEFTIVFADNSIMKWTTDNLDESTANGVFFVGDLPYGKYYLYEKKAPTGYTSGKWYELTVDQTGLTMASSTGP